MPIYLEQKKTNLSYQNFNVDSIGKRIFNGITPTSLWDKFRPTGVQCESRRIREKFI